MLKFLDWQKTLLTALVVATLTTVLWSLHTAISYAMAKDVGLSQAIIVSLFYVTLVILFATSVKEAVKIDLIYGKKLIEKLSGGSLNQDT